MGTAKRSGAIDTAKRSGAPSASVPFVGALHLWESEYLLRHPPTAARPWTVVSTVREPIGQAASAFFHGALRRGVPSDAPTPELARTLVEEGWIRTALRWFDREFMPALGIDVFEHSFDLGAGHALIETEAVRLLLLRQENLAAAPVALAALLGRSGPVPVPVRNQAAGKAYAAAYRRFLAEVRFPSDVVLEAYASRYAEHFYAADELDVLASRWTEGQQATENE